VGWPPPIRITKNAEIRCDASEGSEAESFTATEYEVSAIGSESGKVARRLPVYEFYWANLSRAGTGFLGGLRQSWQFVVGLPRVGYQALVHRSATRRGQEILTAARRLFCVAWVLIVVRLLVSLLLIVAMGQLKVGWLRYYDVIFPLDLATFTIIMGFSILRFLLWLADRRVARNSVTAGLTLAITLLVTQALPLTVLELTGFDQKANSLETWYNISPLGAQESNNGAPWFYYTNSLPGFIPYLEYGLITIWAIATGLFYGLRIHGAPIQLEDNVGAERIERRMARALTGSYRFWVALTFIALVITPIVWWAEFLCVRTTGHSFYFLYDPGLSVAFDPIQSFIKNFWTRFVSYIAFVFVWGVLTLPWLRRGITPLLELVFDISNYFPPVPILDDHTASRLLLGGQRRPPHFGSLDQALVVRLRELLHFVHARHGVPVVVVGHSLGSIIALSALDDWQPEQEVPWIYLITMGNPLTLLMKFFPHLYGQDRSRGGWNLHCVCRWLNLYRAGDPIGRKLSFFKASANTKSPEGVRKGSGTHLQGQSTQQSEQHETQDHPACPLPENRLIGNGGHFDYFRDDEVARHIIAWITSSETPSPPSFEAGNVSECSAPPLSPSPPEHDTRPDGESV